VICSSPFIAFERRHNEQRTTTIIDRAEPVSYLNFRAMNLTLCSYDENSSAKIVEENWHVDVQ
jgi:hypothetical protein